MKPFEQMSKSLARKQPVKTAWVPGFEPKSQSRVGGLRDLLKREERPMSAAEIACGADLPNHNQKLVWLLLKHDVQKGRVLLSDGMYAWNAEFDSAEEAAIRAAIKLLKKSGYTVAKGGAA